MPSLPITSFISYSSLFSAYSSALIKPKYPKICDANVPYGYVTIGSVTIKVIAGIAPKGFPKNAGWYVYCNGRLVVFADQTSLTVWGEDGVRNYHPSLAFFRGFVFFESQELGELPWNTTKTNVDSSSKYYIYAKTMMREATIQVLNKSQPIIDGDIPEEVEKAIFTSNSFIYFYKN